MRPTIVFLFAVLGVLSFQGCSSEEGPKQQNPQSQCPANPGYCPTMGTGQGCCLPDNRCGINLGMGCVPTTAADAGA